MIANRVDEMEKTVGTLMERVDRATENQTVTAPETSADDEKK